MYKLILQSEAVSDMQEAFEWYEEQKEGLGFEFIEEVETCFSQIRNHPQYYTSINERYRRLKVYRFPYLIIYETEEEAVVINSVWNTSRKPKID